MSKWNFFIFMCLLKKGSGLYENNFGWIAYKLIWCLSVMVTRRWYWIICWTDKQLSWHHLYNYSCSLKAFYFSSPKHWIIFQWAKHGSFAILNSSITFTFLWVLCLQMKYYPIFSVDLVYTSLISVCCYSLYVMCKCPNTVLKPQVMSHDWCSPLTFKKLF